MAGYYLYSIDSGVFTQLTTNPTKENGLIIADALLEELEDFLEDIEDEADVAFWPQEREALADLIVKRLAMPDWYADLSLDNAEMWDNVLLMLQDDAGDELGLNFECAKYESVYWDCAELAAAQGATMMAEPNFGGSGFRYSVQPADKEFMYSIYTPQQAKELLAQLQSVESHFIGLPDEPESPREQFFEGLLPPVTNAVENNRFLWVQTDT